MTRSMATNSADVTDQVRSGPMGVADHLTGKRKIALLRRELARLEKASIKFGERRTALPIGSSRARVNTANARWARATEARDRVERELREALDAAMSAADGNARCPDCYQPCVPGMSRCAACLDIVRSRSGARRGV